MAKIKVKVNSNVNQKPNELGNPDIYVDYGLTYVFRVEDFITTTVGGIYQDPENDPPYKLKFITEWSESDNSSLKFNGIDVVANQEITFNDINSELLIFYPDLTVITERRYEGCLITVSDTGSELYYDGAVKIYINVNAQ